MDITTGIGDNPTLVEGVVVDGMGNANANYIRADSYLYGMWRNWIVANMYRGGYSGNVDNNIFNSVYLNCHKSNENRLFILS